MSAALEVLRAGIQTTLQDAGRRHHRALGVPVSGALDAVALRLVNLVAGNPADCAALEMLYSGVTVVAAGGSVRVALACANGTIESDSTPARPLPAWRSAVLAPGERLRVGAPMHTATAYLAVEGGYAVSPVLGSVSTYVQGRLGGLDGRALRAGDVIPLAQCDAARGSERALEQPPRLSATGALRIMPGPQTEFFAPDALERLANGVYRVLPASNRAGLRLEGPALAHEAGHDLLSEGVATGSLQVPGSGLPVLLIGDHPTVGGYPKIATVISADLPAAGRLRIGAEVRFALVDAAAAEAARRMQGAALDAIARSLRTVAS